MSFCVTSLCHYTIWCIVTNGTNNLIGLLHSCNTFNFKIGFCSKTFFRILVMLVLLNKEKWRSTSELEFRFYHYCLIIIVIITFLLCSRQSASFNKQRKYHASHDDAIVVLHSTPLTITSNDRFTHRRWRWYPIISWIRYFIILKLCHGLLKMNVSGSMLFNFVHIELKSKSNEEKTLHNNTAKIRFINRVLQNCQLRSWSDQL